MDTIKAILTRRSIRKYTIDPIEDNIIEDLLRSAMTAPSAGNEQPWHFLVISDKTLLNKIPDFHPYSKMLLKAPVAILVCGDESLEKYKGFWVQDCSAATENILLAAHCKGLGAVWLGIYPLKDRMDGIRELLNIPEGITPFSLISIGYPAEEKPPSERYNLLRIHRNQW